MPDPSDIRRRRTQAEQDEADYLLRELMAGANLIHDDAAERSRRERESARLMGRPVAGDDNFIPQIGLDPGLPSVVPEAYQGGDDRTFQEMEGAEQIADERARERSAPLRRASPLPEQRGGSRPFDESLMSQIVPGMDGRGALPETEDWEAYGNTPGARELAAAQRERDAERIALREMQRETGEETTERLRREWGERGLLGRSFDQEMPPVTIPGLGVEYSPAAVFGGISDALTFGHGDELAAFADQARYGGDYETHRQRRDTEARDVRDRFPASYGAGMASQVPALMAASVGTAGLAPNAARTMMLGEAATMGGLAAHGASAAPLDARGADVRRGAELGLGFAGAGQVAGEAATRAAPMMRRAADSLDEWAEPLRARGMIGTGLEALRRVDDLPGGIREFVRSGDEYGISPRGSVHSVDTAQRRAAAVRAQSSGTLDDVFNRMDLEERADDVVAQWNAPSGRAAPGAPTMPPTRAPGRRAPEPSYREPAPAPAAPPTRGRVNLEPVAGILDDLANRNARIPGQRPVVEGAQELAGQYREHGGVRTFREAQDLVESLDRPANWNASTSPVGSRLPAVAERARDLRRGVRNAMDEAVDQVDPALGEAYRGARRQNQVGRIVEGRGRDMALREASNRQISPSDYIAGLSGFTEGGIMEGARNVLFNRLLRGREATLGAAGAERLADTLRGGASRARPPTGAPLRSRVAGAASATGPAPRPAAAQSAEPVDIENLPVVEPAEGFEEINLDDLPLVEPSEGFEEVEF
jgi:hypothetical protein